MGEDKYESVMPYVPMWGRLSSPPNLAKKGLGLKSKPAGQSRVPWDSNLPSPTWRERGHPLRLSQNSRTHANRSTLWLRIRFPGSSLGIRTIGALPRQSEAPGYGSEANPTCDASCQDSNHGWGFESVPRRTRNYGVLWTPSLLFRVTNLMTHSYESFSEVPP